MTFELEYALEIEFEVGSKRDEYEAERVGLGDQFVDELAAVEARILQGPYRFPQLAGTTMRRALMKRFPFMVVYEVRGDVIRVIAVAHQRRDMRYWSGRS